MGVSRGAAAEYAHDASTGIRWTRPDLGMKRDEFRAPVDRGDWARYATEPFVLDEPGPVTVWIRFNYANENQMDARWQADDARIERVDERSETAAAAEHHACPPPVVAERYRVLCGTGEPYLVSVEESACLPSNAVPCSDHARNARVEVARRTLFRLLSRHDSLERLVELHEATGDPVQNAMRRAKCNLPQKE